ncbi:MAG: SMC-Scp complex subunit ScpB [Gammaproteobacteria bacterium]|jgi:segregation and condensation protein B|nr:SMC-Scp complex subunit ScpB [Gammaproteobacteria bacterium]MBT4607238.1 SMC-Scp complex subunit ScpB [Thiotrichales bacterium]MBT3472796.1 SMC-Scp complex subunit ScpB [Gammaproteobacteria bacterium]MBT3967566.1 SMC-Scp complex subunit ScpB [Gammaproteobacteria bacterium]MBT4080058.1 SMC-Scp complex subunit ScpB [Gammaproteobacteria bacterium]
METNLKNIVEAALMAAGKPLSVKLLLMLFEEDAQPERQEVVAALKQLQQECEGRGYEVVEVASGWRMQIRQGLSTWINRLWEEKPARYSRALLETMALIAYRQPITRGEIEEIRGVAVSTNIMKTLQEREWIRMLGHRDVPGRPAMYGTSRKFLDYFGLKSLEEMPTLMELKELGPLNEEFKLGNEEPALEEEEEAHRVDLELAVNDQIEIDSNEPKISETNEPQDV